MKNVWSLSLQSSVISPEHPAYHLHCWPPPDDFPVSVTANGEILSRAGDQAYDLRPYSQKSVIIYFNDQRFREDNADVFRRVVQWWMWGREAKITTATLAGYAALLKPLFLLCSENGISATKLYRYPKIYALLTSRIAPSMADTTLALLHELWMRRDEIGFAILDQTALRHFSRSLPTHELEQLPYMPPRIWLYQVGRLRKCLEEFVLNDKKIRDLFEYCYHAYVIYHGVEALRTGNVRRGGPFTKPRKHPGRDPGYLGPFLDAADNFGVGDLLRQWCPHEGIDLANKGIATLAQYFNMIVCAGAAYIINFSAMRISEAMSLRSNCLRQEADPRLGAATLLEGCTSKGVDDPNALWVTSPSVEIAVRAMRTVAELRATVATRVGISLPALDVTQPYLFIGSYEPWARRPSAIISGGEFRTNRTPSYASPTAPLSSIFSRSELTITQEDLDVALLVTPSLNPSDFKVGAQWPLSFHSLRRTAAVNMTASGLISSPSIQYQLKHAAMAQSLYYGRGASGLALSRRAVEQYIRTVYEVISLQADQLPSHRYASPVSDTAKRAVIGELNLIDGTDLRHLVKRGVVSIRETVLGACTKPSPCEFGGVETIVNCVSCARAVADKRKLGLLRELELENAKLLEQQRDPSPYKAALLVQQDHIKKAIALVEA